MPASPATLVIATGNAHKVDELGRMLRALGLDVRCVTLAEAGGRSIDETGETFEAVAAQKALSAALETGLPALGDDSGICVDALGGAPGVRSRRFAGPDATDGDNNRLLLERLLGVPPERRGAHYACALGFARPAPGSGAEPAVVVEVGRCFGRLVELPPGAPGRGAGGFGYDPYFLVDGVAAGRTMAELSAAEKDAVSHRGRALAAMTPHLVAAFRRAGG